MKTALSLPLLALLLTACAQHQATHPPTPAARGATPASAAPAITAAQARAGKIISVKPELRFVVVDFSLSGVPAEGTTMAVWRAGQKVAELRITGPSVGTNTAADITAGEVRPGDDVRDP